MNIKAMRLEITEFTFIKTVVLDTEGERFYENIHKHEFDGGRYYELFSECIESIKESFGERCKIIKIEIITKGQYDTFMNVNDGSFRKLTENEKIEYIVLY